MPACEVHFVNNCPLCRANAVGKPPQPLSEPSVLTSENHISTVELPKYIPSPVEKKFTSPIAQQIVEAANNYAESLETVNIIRTEIESMKENLKAAEEKLAEANTSLKSAKLKMQELSRPGGTDV